MASSVVTGLFVLLDSNKHNELSEGMHKFQGLD